VTLAFRLRIQYSYLQDTDLAVRITHRIDADVSRDITVTWITILIFIAFNKYS